MGSTSWLRSNEYLFEHLGPGWPLVTEVIAWKKRKGAGRFGERGKWQCVCYRLFCASHHGPSNLQNAQVWVYAILVLLPNISLSSELRWIGGSQIQPPTDGSSVGMNIQMTRRSWWNIYPSQSPLVIFLTYRGGGERVEHLPLVLKKDIYKRWRN